MANIHNISRRTVLKGVAATGALVGVGSGVGAGADDTVEIVATYSGDEPVHTEEVSEQWLEHVKHVREVQSRLSEGIGEDEWIHAVGREAADASNGNGNENGNENERKLQIRVETDRPAVANRELPEERDGVPIRVSEKTPESNIHYDGHYDDPACGDDEPVECIGGGNTVSAEYVDVDDPTKDCIDRYGHLTATTAVSKDGDQYLMTSAHGFVDAGRPSLCDIDIEGGAAYVGHMCDGNYEYIGDVVEYDHSFDFALIDVATDHDISSEVVDRSVPITGHLSENMLDHLVSTEETVYKKGRRTCRTEGKIVSIDHERTRCGGTREWVELTTEVAGGDSGSPHYRRVGESGTVNGHLSLIGPHVRHHTDDDGDFEYSLCPPAHKISEEYDITFTEINC